MHRLLAVMLVLGVSAPAVRAQDNPAEPLKVIGSDGGTFFSRQCEAGQVLTGIRVRAALVIDAMGIRCTPINSSGSLGTERSVGTLAGGTGGIESSGSCPNGSVVSGQAGARGFPIGIKSFQLRCRRWDSGTRRFTGSVVAVIRVVAGDAVLNRINVLLNPGSLLGDDVPTDCSRQQQPAVLLRGRSGTIVDAAGLTCDEP